MTLLEDVPAGGAEHTEHHRDVATAVDFLGPTTGTWTPVPTFTTPGSVAWTPDATYTWGRWSRIGDLVMCQFECYGDLVKGTASGGFRIAGLPFDLVPADAYYAIGPAFLNKGITLPANTNGLTWQHGYDDTGRRLVLQGSIPSGGNTNILASAFDASITGLDITGTIWYEAAPA